MKKILSLFLTLVMIFALVACGQTATNETGAPKPAGNADSEGFKAALICLHGENSTYDKNFIDAFKVACDNKGVEYTIVTDIPEGEECYNKAAEFADDGYNIIFADSFGHEEYMMKAAKEFPDVQFCHSTGTQAHTAKVANFQDAFASIYEGRFLAGVAAGLKLVELYGDESKAVSDENAKIGYVGAFPYAEVISGYTSFYLGVKSIVPNATMEVQYTNSWYDETAEKTTAQALIADGCKLISQHADSMGSPTACDEANIPNVSYNGVTSKDTFVVASRINWAPYFEYAIECAMKGENIPDDWTGTMVTESVLLTELGDCAAEGTAEKLESVKAELEAGTVKVFDCATFTVKEALADTSDFSKAAFITADDEGHLTAYKADVDDDGTFVGETNVIKTEGDITYFAESEFRSAPYFDIIIDGITIK
ncbi:MAG: BMP family ABC transporter substrate-binding protein [Clostridia bacterium]|nr:BMP family ABC transporter substrate-binding protein [Clostridia bacterium]